MILDLEPQVNRPNILFMIADDHRYDALGTIDNSVVSTPNLDALASDGTSFSHTFIMGSCSPAVCLPSRAMLLAGMGLFKVFDGDVDTSVISQSGADTSKLSPDSKPELDIYRVLDESRPLFPEILRNHGYRTYGIGKWHNGPDTYERSFSGGGSIFFGGMCEHDAVPIHQFDPDGNYSDVEPEVTNEFSTTLFADTAIELLDGHDMKDPFCMYVAFTAPHDPRTPPDQYRQMYQDPLMPVSASYMEEPPFDMGVMGLRDEMLAPRPLTRETVQEHTAEYFGMITHLDFEVGRLLTKLQDLGVADDTLVVYTADHGLALGRHGLLGKQNLYDHSVRVPLIMRGPDVPRRQSLDQMCYLHDLNSTILEYAGIHTDSAVDSKSLLPVIKGHQSTHRQQIFSVYQSVQHIGEEDDYQRMIRNDRYKLIRYEVDGKQTIQLFDLDQDPNEMVNLSNSAAHAEIMTDLLHQLAIMQSDAEDPIAVV